MKAIYLREDPRRKNSHTRTPASDEASASYALCTQTREQAILHGLDLIHELTVCLRQGDVSTYAAIREYLPFLVNVVATANVALGKTCLPTGKTVPIPPQPSPATEPAVLEFLVGSLFLANCHAYLTSHPNLWERLHLVTGQRLSRTQRTLDQMSKVALCEQSAVGAVADPISLKQALMAMESWGHALYGLYHSHPGEGVLATRPSSTDMDTHERYERGGVPLVGCIFVRDGTFRFFRHSREPFRITISGTGIVPINEAEHVFQIQNTQAPRVVSFEALATED
jgi:hypothetical protein